MVKDYPQMSIGVPPDVRARLHALSRVSGLPQWRVVNEAIECYLRQQSRDNLELVERFTTPNGWRSSRTPSKAADWSGRRNESARANNRQKRS